MSANSNGALLEVVTEAVLLFNGYEKIPDGAWLYKHRKDADLKGKKYYGKEVVVGESSVKGKRRRVEFFLVNQDAFPDGQLIECKWQEGGGSAEDKLVKLPNDIKKTGIPTIIIAAGPGFSSGIIAHLKERVDHKIVRAVYTTDEFISAVNRGVLGSGIIKPLLLRVKQLPPQQQELFKGAL